MTMPTTHRDTSNAGLTRSALLRKAGVGGAALVVGGGIAPASFAGPLRFAGRSQAGSLSIVQ